MGKRARRVALHPPGRAVAQQIRRIVQLPSARRMPEQQHLLVTDPGPGRHRRLEARLQQLSPTLLAGLPIASPLRCQLYPPMNDSHPPRASSRGPASRSALSRGPALAVAMLRCSVLDTKRLRSSGSGPPVARPPPALRAGRVGARKAMTAAILLLSRIVPTFAWRGQHSAILIRGLSSCTAIPKVSRTRTVPSTRLMSKTA